MFIGIILMLQWSTNIPEIKPRFQFMDLFAGCAQAYDTWLLAHYMFESSMPALYVLKSLPRSECGFSCVKIDHNFRPGQRTMDFLSSAGFLPTGMYDIVAILCGQQVF